MLARYILILHYAPFSLYLKKKGIIVPYFFLISGFYVKLEKSYGYGVFVGTFWSSFNVCVVVGKETGRYTATTITNMGVVTCLRSSETRLLQ